MEIQIIKRKPIVFRVKNKEYEFIKPYYLMPVDGLRIIKGVVRGSTLCFNIEGGVISYNQLKNLFVKKAP